MSHYYPFFIRFLIATDSDTTDYNPNLLQRNPLTLDSEYWAPSVAPPKWAIEVGNAPGAGAADLTVGNSLAVGLSNPSHFNSNTDFPAYIQVRTLISDGIPSTAALTNPDLPALRVSAVDTPPTPQTSNHALGVIGKTSLQGSVDLTTGDLDVFGATHLHLTAPSLIIPPYDVTMYTLEADGRLRLTNSFVTLQGTTPVSDPKVNALWQILGIGVKYHAPPSSTNPNPNEEPLLTVDEYGEITIHKSLSIKGSVTATTVETGAVNAGVVNAGAVNAGVVNAGAVNAGTVTADTVDANRVKARRITARNINAGNINAGNINALNINALNINALLLNAFSIAAYGVSAVYIGAGVIDADHINANTVDVGSPPATEPPALEPPPSHPPSSHPPSSHPPGPGSDRPGPQPPADNGNVTSGAIPPPPPPPIEGGSGAQLKIYGGFIGQSMAGGFAGPGKYIVVGQAPPIGEHGGRYGVTIRNGGHFCSLRVIPSGDSILSWGEKERFRIRYEGSRWKKGRGGKLKHVFYSRDIVNVDRRGQLLVFGGITTSSYHYRSDERLKECIVPLEGTLEKVMALRGVSYSFRQSQHDAYEEISEVDASLDEEQPTEESEFEGDALEEAPSDAGRRRLGLLAQEVEKVFPEVVSTDGRGYKTLDATQLNAILFEAIRDQQKIIEIQEVRIAKLESSLARLHLDA